MVASILEGNIFLTTTLTYTLSICYKIFRSEMATFTIVRLSRYHLICFFSCKLLYNDCYQCEDRVEGCLQVAASFCSQPDLSIRPITQFWSSLPAVVHTEPFLDRCLCYTLQTTWFSAWQTTWWKNSHNQNCTIPWQNNVVFHYSHLFYYVITMT